MITKRNKEKELRMVMGNVSNRQLPYQRAENNRRPPMSLQHSEIIPNLDVGFSWILNKHVYLFVENGRHTYLRNL